MVPRNSCTYTAVVAPARVKVYQCRLPAIPPVESLGTWHRWDQPVWQSAEYIVPVGATYTAGIVGWRIYTGTIFRGTDAAVCRTEQSCVSGGIIMLGFLGPLGHSIRSSCS